MSDLLFVTLCGVVGGVLLVVSAVAFRCNLRRFREARTTPPLDGVDVSGAAILDLRPPRGWPGFDAVSDPRQAAAYASLADDHALNCVLLGEMLLAVGSGAMGVGLALFGEWRGVPVLLAAAVLVLVAAALRLRGTRRWEPVHARYREVYESLTATPLPPPRRRGLFALLRRR